jgi:hypothetical protein
MTVCPRFSIATHRTDSLLGEGVRATRFDASAAK